MPRERPFWEIPWRFAVHAVVGSLIFGIITGFAIGLGLLVRWLRHEISDNFIIHGLIGAEYLLFATDLCARVPETAFDLSSGSLGADLACSAGLT
jgi:hypothetical protein